MNCKPDEKPGEEGVLVICWSYWHPKAKRRIYAKNGKPFAWRARRKPEGTNTGV